MRYAWLAAAGVLAAALIAGAAAAKEPVKVKGDEDLGKLTVKDTGEKVKVKKSGSKYKVKETGEKFKVKETRAGSKVKGTSTTIKHSKVRARANEEEADEAAPKQTFAKPTPRARWTPAFAVEKTPPPAAR